MWQTAGALAHKMGGHGGMDFLMDLRLCYCLQNGLPLDMDVYDLAASCSLAELSERSCRNRGATQDVPDFNRVEYKAVNLSTLEKLATEKNLEKITVADLLQAGLVRKRQLVKILGDGTLTKKLEVEANAFSKKAEEAITAAGGTIAKV